MLIVLFVLSGHDFTTYFPQFSLNNRAVRLFRDHKHLKLNNLSQIKNGVSWNSITHLLQMFFLQPPLLLCGGCIDFQINNWESQLNCPLQFSLAFSLIPSNYSSPMTSPSPPSPFLILFLPSHLLSFCAHADVDPVLWQVVQEGMGLLAWLVSQPQRIIRQQDALLF